MISKTRIENRLRPFLLIKLPKEVYDQMVAEDFLEVFNRVCEDLNNVAFLRLERYSKLTGADTSEDDDYTNYLLQRVIVKVLEISLTDSDWQNIKWTFMNDRVAFNQTTDGAQLEILYLGKPEPITAGTDEIDLPEEVEGEYLELLETFFVNKFTNDGGLTYQQALEIYGMKAEVKVGKNVYYNKGVKRSWMGQAGDDFTYDIKNQYISLDSFITDIDGNLVYTGD